MILSRIARHMKQQHWTAVFIELVIVILGVFIGLQVSNWNEQRQDRGLEKQYLQRLHVDIQRSIDRANYNIRDMRMQYRLESDMLADLASCRLDKDGRKRFATGAYFFGMIDSAPLVRGTIDELRSSGRIGLIRDVRLRTKLANVVVESDIFSRDMPMIVAHVSRAIFFLQKRVQLDSPPEGLLYDTIASQGMPEGSYTFDFPALCKDPRVAAVVSNVQVTTFNLIGMMQSRLKGYKELLGLIDSELSRMKGDRSR